jgi:hypothetical protein
MRTRRVPQAGELLPPAADGADPDVAAQKALIKALVVTVEHFFGGFAQLFRSLSDRRDPVRVRYSLSTLMATGVLMFLLRLGARRQIAALLRANGPSTAKYKAWLQAPQCPHGDTLNYAFARGSVAEVQDVVTDMVATLIRRKLLYPERLDDHYYIVAVDGTGFLTYAERHCSQCLTRTHHGHTSYYHPVLEAKLVTPSGWVFSLMTEFIENPGEQPTKQDCELKAFYRLMRRLKRRFPRLPICLTLDGLYAGGPTFALCERYQWKYMVVLQDADIPYINSEFAVLSELEPHQRLRFETGTQFEIEQDLRWVNDIAYVDSDNTEHTVAVIQCRETQPKKEHQDKTTSFKWVTNFRVTADNVVTLANQGGRLRWKIENEGFNVQKNGGYALEHRYTEDPIASKIFYLLLQIAHLLAQLIERGSLFRRAFPKGVGSAKNIAFRLLEAWRNLRLHPLAVQSMLDARIQIRFAPP